MRARFREYIYGTLFLLLVSANAQEGSSRHSKSPANIFTNTFNAIARPKAGVLSEGAIAGFSEYPPAVQKLLRAALALSQRGLGYKMGSDDPANGGMDCSGTIYYLLQQDGIRKTPRSSYDQYVWVRGAGTFHSAKGMADVTKNLRPGNLLFWAGTYATKGRSPAVSHVMIYLGKRKSDGKAVMIGGDDGRRYDGKARWGVGVFDFTLPQAKSKAKFLGYAEIPGLKIPAKD